METSLKPPSSPTPSSPLTELSTSPLSDLFETPSISSTHSTADLTCSMGSMLDPVDRYPSPISSGTPSANLSGLKRAEMSDADAIKVRTDGPPAKRRRTRAPAKPRTTKHIDLDRLAAAEGRDEHLDRLLQALRSKKKIVVIAGAGISVSAGIPDFRSQTGLFTTLGGGKHLFDASVYKHDASTEAFHTMVREMADLTAAAMPTPFHHMLASMAKEKRLLRLYTQNVDCIDTRMENLATTVPLPLKPTSGWPTTIQLHGGLDNMVCTKCGDLRPFDGRLFEGPEAPLCMQCQMLDETRTKFALKRSHGVGRLRPRIVLYNEYNPDEEAIGNVSKADLRRIPDAVVVAGTSMKIPGVRRLVKQLCQLTRSRPNGMTAWINTDPEPPGVEFRDCWDFIVRGKSDDMAELVNLPRFDSDIGTPDSYLVTGDKQKEERALAALERMDRFDVVLEQRLKLAPELAPNASSQPSTDGSATLQDPKTSLAEPARRGIPTPSASPKGQSPSPVSQTAVRSGGLHKQCTLSFSGRTSMIMSTSLKPVRATVRKPRVIKQAKQPTQPAQPKQATRRPKNALPQAYKTTKPVTSATPNTSLKDVVQHDPPPKLESQSLPKLRPSVMPNPFRMVKPGADHPIGYSV